MAGELQHAINGLLQIHTRDSTIKLQVIAENPFANEAEQPSKNPAVNKILDQTLVSSSRNAAADVSNHLKGLLSAMAANSIIFQKSLSSGSSFAIYRFREFPTYRVKTKKGFFTRSNFLVREILFIELELGKKRPEFFEL